MKLPRPLNGKINVEFKKPDTRSIIEVYKKVDAGKIYSAMLSILESGIESIEGEKPELSELKDLPIVSAEFCVTEIFKEYSISSKVENIYKCPRCGYLIKHEENEDEDSRDDILKIPIKYSTNNNPYELNLSKNNTVKIISNDKVTAEFHSFKFRDPTLGDLIRLQSDQTKNDPYKALMKLNYDCLIDVDGHLYEEDFSDDIEQIKNRYLYEIMDFPDIRDFNKISNLFRTYGYQNKIDLICPECEKKFDGRIEWTGFFAYALRSTAMSEGK